MSMTKDQVRSTEEALRLALEALESNRRTHHYCEDTWYSCPKHEDGCANDSEGDECNCGADKANAEIDQAITAIKAALEAKNEKPCPEFWDWLPKAYRHGDVGDEPRFTKYNMEVAFLAGKQSAALKAKDEPVAWRDAAIRLGEELSSVGPDGYYDMDAKEWLDWTMEQNPRGKHSLPQRTWVGLTDDDIEQEFGFIDELLRDCVQRTEAKLKEKNT